ncbi:MAG: translocation/assembly module TamB domain-containing protein, partial [Bacteroidota bacterium]|nr:translocation/assembly module TamB domain-containing protein [Bacteroidota bacterium]
MDFDVTLKNTDAITHLFLPSLKIAKNTKVHGLFNSSEKGLAFQGETDFIELNGIKFTELNFNAKENGDKYTFKTSAKELVLYENESTEEKEADTLKITKLGLDNLGFSASFKNDTISYLLHWDDISDADRNRANIDGYLSIIDAKNANNHFNEVSITINDSLWIASKNNNILFSDSLISFTNLAFNRGEQKIAVNGNISYLPQDKFDVVLNNFDISNFDMFFSSMNFDVDGIINADFSFRNIKKNQVPQFFGDFNIKELKFNKETLGDMKLTSQWMDSLQSFKIDGDITYHGNKGSRKLLSLNGDYCPKTSLGNDSIYLKSSVHGLTLKALNPFFDDFMSELTGRATGNLVLGGSLSKPELTGSLDIVRAGLRIDYLNTKYYFADKVSFDTDAIVFDNIMIYDSLGNTSVLNGKIKHNYFSDYYINLHITPNEFSGLNTDRSHNSLFYGSAFATGKVDITGPVSAISFNVKVKTNKGTKVIIPISTDESAMESDFITFISTNQEEEDIVSYLSLKPEGFNMNLEFDITPDAEAEIILPFAMGNINAKGNGNFRLEITSAGDFSMYGDYIIDEGDFIFKVPTIQLRREFDIRRGGKIAWSGDPYDADINIDAVYKVKSSLKGMPAIEALNP